MICMCIIGRYEVSENDLEFYGIVALVAYKKLEGGISSTSV